VAKYTGSRRDRQCRSTDRGGHNAGGRTSSSWRLFPRCPCRGTDCGQRPDSVLLTWKAAAPEFRVSASWWQSELHTAGSVTTPSTPPANMNTARRTSISCSPCTRPATPMRRAKSRPRQLQSGRPYPPAFPRDSRQSRHPQHELVWQRDTDRISRFILCTQRREDRGQPDGARLQRCAGAAGVEYQYQVTATDMAGTRAGNRRRPRLRSVRTSESIYNRIRRLIFWLIARAASTTIKTLCLLSLSGEWSRDHYTIQLVSRFSIDVVVTEPPPQLLP